MWLSVTQLHNLNYLTQKFKTNWTQIQVKFKNDTFNLNLNLRIIILKQTRCIKHNKNIL